MPHKIGFVVVSSSGHEDGFSARELMIHAPTVSGWRSPRVISPPVIRALPQNSDHLQCLQQRLPDVRQKRTRSAGAWFPVFPTCPPVHHLGIFEHSV
ncbi:centrosomal protein 104 [Rhinolophus ferrumequinum]|uniref:Centrosomal protein 104 n=1 Tax=Rhinolophus ferrumequinum TaxID=59479 RepID=A0A7J7X3F5_RHIFE|nr:centrosomal protein 104 [Rhinolophus ferrumequinum]